MNKSDLGTWANSLGTMWLVEQLEKVQGQCMVDSLRSSDCDPVKVALVVARNEAKYDLINEIKELIKGGAN